VQLPHAAEPEVELLARAVRELCILVQTQVAGGGMYAAQSRNVGHERDSGGHARSALRHTQHDCFLLLPEEQGEDAGHNEQDADDEADDLPRRLARDLVKNEPTACEGRGRRCLQRRRGELPASDPLQQRLSKHT
jgi:hypothetical protein